MANTELDLCEFVEACPALLMATDSLGKIAYCNSLIEKLLGYERRQLQGLIHNEVIVGRDSHSLLECQEALGIHKSGRKIPLKISTSTIDFRGESFTLTTISDLSERKALEAELRRSAAETQLILDALPSLVFFKDCENQILRVNQAVCDSLGIPRAGIEGKHSQEIYPENAEKLYRDDLEVMSTGRAKLGYVQPLKDRWIQTDKVPVRNNHGDIDKLIVVATDITEQRRALEAETSLRQLLQKTAEIGQIGGWEVNLQSGGTPVWSPEVCRIHEVAVGHQPTLEEAIAYYLPESRERIERAIETAIASHQPWDLEATIKTAKGNLRRVRAVGTPEIVDDRCVKLWGTFQDITQYHAATTQLRLMEQVIEKSADAVFFIAENGNINYVNQQAASYLGYSRTELRAKNIEEIDTSFAQHGWHKFWQEIREAKAISFEGQQLRKDATRYDCQTRMLYIEFEGEPIVVSLVNDITEANRARKELRRSKFSVDNSTDAVYWVRHDGRFFYVNKAACEMLGYTEQQLLARRVSDIDPQYPPDVWAEHWKNMERDRYQRIETMHIAADGTSIWTAMNIHFYQFEGESFIVGAAHDITDAKRAQTELAENEERYGWALRNGNLGIWDWKLATGQVTFSDVTKTQLGYSPDEVWDSFDDWESRLHPDDYEMATTNAKKLVERPRDVYDSTFRLRTKEGDYRWIRSIGKGVFDESGDLERCVGVHLDVTDSRQAQAELVQSENRYRTLYEESPVMHANVSPEDGVIRNCNELLARRLGYENKHQLIGKSIFDVYDPACFENVQQAFDQFVETGRVENAELTLRTLDGEQVPVILNVSALRDASGKISQSSSTWVDVTDLRKKTEDLKKANEDLEQFAYIASHDLKSPLQAIDNLANWLQEDLEEVLPPDSASHLYLLRNRVKRMEMLLNDLLAYSRASRMRGEHSDFQIADIIDSSVQLLNIPAEFKIECALETTTITGFRTPLETVVRNLIGNAVKHHDRTDGSIQIRAVPAERDKRFVQFSIEDDGPGIEPRFREKVFVMFQTLQSRDKFETSGMGLAVVKKLVESEGGEVWIESNKTKGTTFSFTWPKNANLLR